MELITINQMIYGNIVANTCQKWSFKIIIIVIIIYCFFYLALGYLCIDLAIIDIIWVTLNMSMMMMIGLSEIKIRPIYRTVVYFVLQPWQAGVSNNVLIKVILSCQRHCRPGHR